MKSILTSMLVVALCAVTSNAAITVDSSNSWTSGNSNLGGIFNASASDKLVVVVTGEHGFNQFGGGWAGDVFYDGVQLTPVVKRQPIKADAGPPVVLVDDTYNAMYYLDSPGSVHVAGAITTSGFSSRGSVAVIALSGTAAGVGNSVIGNRDTNTAFLNTSAGSIVIGSYGMGGTGNTANRSQVTTPDWDAEVARQGNGGGRNWDGHVVAYKNNVSAGLNAYTFTDSGTPEPDGRTGRHVIAGEFQALVPEPASMALLGMGGLMIAARRRR